ncbi:MAG: hypothetical protein EKK42_00565 [Pseudonocardiaceae bacterium]|nr:MAG: hypothetical protein EKK42_00565 [Pseudonocardiaceae bacterium]
MAQARAGGAGPVRALRSGTRSRSSRSGGGRSGLHGTPRSGAGSAGALVDRALRGRDRTALTLTAAGSRAALRPGCLRWRTLR